MIKIENLVLPSPAQMEAIIRGMRNPMNSWGLSDSYIEFIRDEDTFEKADYQFHVGEKDMNLMRKLNRGGAVHAKYKRMMVVYLDITAPLYFFKEMDTYKIGTVCNSCSTMHKIQAKEFTLEDFSLDHAGMLTKDVYIQHIIPVLNINRDLYLETKDKNYWWQMIQLLPSSYNQKRTYMFNYEVLTEMYKWRKAHKLDEWVQFCEFIEKNLPYAELITVESEEEHGIMTTNEMRAMLGLPPVDKLSPLLAKQEV
jgi:hypothetical protein